MDETTPQPGQPQPMPQPQPLPQPQAGGGQPLPQGQPMVQPGPYGPYVPYPPAPAATGRRESPFRRGFSLGAGAGLGAGVALLILGIVGSLLSMVALIGAAGAAAAAAGANQTSFEPTRTIWGKEAAKGRIRAINITGAIMTDAADGAVLTGGTYGYEVAQVLDRLEARDADALVLLINTPGGSITGSRAMVDAIDRYRQRTGKKVFAYVQGMSASGGMYTMAGADDIVADHGSLVGSIGVILGPLSRYRDVVAIDGGLFGGGVTTTGGITEEYITAGRGKDVGNPYRDLTAEERANLQSFIDAEYANFVNLVSSRREIPAATIRDQLGASLFDTARAKQVGLIDDVMGRDEAFRRFAEAAGLDPADTRVVSPQAPALWTTLLGAETRVWGEAPAARPEGGQPARATSSLCAQAGTPLVFYGSVAGICG